MSTSFTDELAEGVLHGLRMTAEEFLALPESKERYELIDGVIFMSPGPTLLHQETVAELIFQLKLFLDNQPLGKVFPEVDLNLGPGTDGGDVVYRPDVVFASSTQLGSGREQLRSIPSLVIEVISPATRNFDRQTKRADYERAGVQEYWLIDPEKRSMVFWRLQQGKYVEASVEGDAFVSDAVPGFRLDLNRLRRILDPQ